MDNKNLDEEIKISGENQYLLFLIDDEIYGMSAKKVVEIVEFTPFTKVPNMQSFIKGVTNIRGDIIPLIDLKVRFGFDEIKITKRTSIIVTNVENRIKDTIMKIGMIVDEVYEVDDIDEDDIQEAPEFGTKIDKYFIKHMAKYDNKYIYVLDIDHVLNYNELSKVNNGKL